MARLPQVGSDSGEWGQVLNDFLTVSHTDDGMLSDGAVHSSALGVGSVGNNSIDNGAISESKLDSTLANKVNMASGVMLAGDVTGVFDASVVSAINGVTVSGTPIAGDIVKATSPTTATWQADSLRNNVYEAKGNVTARAGDMIFADTSGGTFTITLPPAVAGAIVRVKKAEGGDDTTTVNVVPTGSATIDGEVSWQAGYMGGSQAFVSDGTNWYLQIQQTITPPDPPVGPSNARWTGDFIDSIGISAALNETTAINMPNATLINRLNFAGVKRIRTVIPLGSPAQMTAAITRMNLLVNNGCKIIHTLAPLGADNVTNHTAIDSKISSLLDFLNDNPTIGNAAYAVEYFNELDRDKTADPNDFDLNIAYGVPKLWARTSTLRANGVKILGPSLLGYKLGGTFNDASETKTTFDAANAQTIENFFDFGNLHTYFGTAKLPETTFQSKTPNELPSGWATQFASVAPTGGTADDPMNRYRYYSWYISRQKPIITTETNSQGSGSTGELRSGSFVPRILLESFRMGVQQTYIFNLVMYNGYGLFGNESDDYEVKPAGQALHNLTTILSDAATSYTPSGTLDYSVPAGIRHVLLQKSDGTFWLCLWKAAEYTTTASAVTLAFTNPQTIQQYRDLNLTPMVSVGPATSFNVTIGPKVSIFKVT